MANRQLPHKVELLADIVCIPCGCVSGYGPPPSVGECPCVCHDTARLWWSMRPWRLEPNGDWDAAAGDKP